MAIQLICSVKRLGIRFNSIKIRFLGEGEGGILSLVLLVLKINRFSLLTDIHIFCALGFTACIVIQNIMVQFVSL